MRDPIYTIECEVIFTHAYVHADIPNTNTRACLACIPTFIPVHNAIVHNIHKRAHCTHLSVWSVELRASAAAMCCAPSSPMELYPRLYAHVRVRRTIQRTCVAHDARSHTYNRVQGPIYLIQTHVHALHVYLPSFQCTTQYSIPCTIVFHYYAFMRTIHVLHSLECLERRVVGKCCSNVLRSRRAYGVPLKAVRTCVCKKNDTAHVHSSRCAIPYIQPRARTYTPMHTCMPLHVFFPTFQCTTQ
jgi:hypothetical protein